MYSGMIEPYCVKVNEEVGRFPFSVKGVRDRVLLTLL